MAATARLGYRSAAAFLVLVVLASACSDESAVEGERRTGLLGFAPATEEVTDGPTFLLPVSIGFPFEIHGALVSDGPAERADAVSTAVMLGVPAGDGFDDVVSVWVVEADADRDVSDSERENTILVDVNGVEARSSESPIATSLDWFVDGRSVSVLAPRGMADLVVDIALAIDPSAEGEALLRSVPGTHQVIWLGSFAASGDGDSTSWSVLVEVDGESLSIDAHTLPDGMGPLTALTASRQVRRIEVRGADGAWSRSTFVLESPDGGDPPEITMVTVSWMERPGLLITVRGNAELETLLAVAESLEPVSRSEFESKGPAYLKGPSIAPSPVEEAASTGAGAPTALVENVSRPLSVPHALFENPVDPTAEDRLLLERLVVAVVDADPILPNLAGNPPWSLGEISPVFWNESALPGGAVLIGGLVTVTFDEKTDYIGPWPLTGCIDGKLLGRLVDVRAENLRGVSVIADVVFDRVTRLGPLPPSPGRTDGEESIEYGTLLGDFPWYSGPCEQYSD